MARVLFGRQWFLSLFLSFSPLFIVVVVTLLEEAEYSRRVTAPGGSGERRMGAFLRRPLKQATDLIIQSARVSYIRVGRKSRSVTKDDDARRY
jgi:hypothetical protein